MLDLIYAIDETLADLIGFLPDSPFLSYLTASQDADFVEVLKWVNLFVDVPTIILMIEAWTVSIAGYYLISVGLRWVKAVG